MSRVAISCKHVQIEISAAQGELKYVGSEEIRNWPASRMTLASSAQRAMIVNIVVKNVFYVFLCFHKNMFLMILTYVCFWPKEPQDNAYL